MKATFAIDHLRYLSERRYRRQVHLTLRKAMRKGGIYDLPVDHEPGQQCCQKEPWPATMARLTKAIRDDGAGMVGLLLESLPRAEMDRLDVEAAVARPYSRLFALLSTLLAGATGAGMSEHLKRDLGAGKRVVMTTWMHDPQLWCVRCLREAGRAPRERQRIAPVMCVDARSRVCVSCRST